LTAVVTIALGIGANATIFSFVNGILLRPLPYTESDRLAIPISFNLGRGSDEGSITYADYLDWKNEGIFEYVAALNLLSSADLTGGDAEPERVQVAAVTEDYFSVMGSPALLGRTFLPEDYNPPGPARALIITHRLWQKRFGSDPNIMFACDAGMGSSAMGASAFGKRLRDAGRDDVRVTHAAIESVPVDADLVVVHQDLAHRARAARPDVEIVTIQSYLGDPALDTLDQRLTERTTTDAEQ
jgi:galactitol-specific phosphotransferase system IIB component